MIGEMRIGIADHFGWAVAVTASADHKVVDRRRIELVEPDVCAKLRFTTKATVSTSPRRLRSSCRYASVGRSSDVRRVRRSRNRRSPAPVISISLRALPLDFPDDIAVQRQAPYEARADAIMYRQVLVDLAHARGWDVHFYLDDEGRRSSGGPHAGERADEALLQGPGDAGAALDEGPSDRARRDDCRRRPRLSQPTASSPSTGSGGGSRRRSRLPGPPRARPRRCSARPRRTSAWRAAPDAGRSRRRSCPPGRRADRRSRSPPVGSMIAAPPRPNTSWSGSSSGKSSGNADSRDVLRRPRRRTRPIRSRCGARWPASRRCRPRSGRPRSGGPGGRGPSVRAACGSPSTPARRCAPAGCPPRPRSSPAPKAWNSRS